MFPSSKVLPEEYAYAKKVRILLPIAWVHKGINFLKKRSKSKEDWYSASEKLEIAEHRLKLMKQQNLAVDKKKKSSK